MLTWLEESDRMSKGERLAVDSAKTVRKDYRNIRFRYALPLSRDGVCCAVIRKGYDGEICGDLTHKFIDNEYYPGIWMWSVDGVIVSIGKAVNGRASLSGEYLRALRAEAGRHDLLAQWAITDSCVRLYFYPCELPGTSRTSVAERLEEIKQRLIEAYAPEWQTKLRAEKYQKAM